MKSRLQQLIETLSTPTPARECGCLPCAIQRHTKSEEGRKMSVSDHEDLVAVGEGLREISTLIECIANAPESMLDQGIDFCQKHDYPEHVKELETIKKFRAVLRDHIDTTNAEVTAKVIALNKKAEPEAKEEEAKQEVQ